MGRDRPYALLSKRNRPGKEIVAGNTLIRMTPKEEAMEWIRRFPEPAVDGLVYALRAVTGE